MKFQISIAHAFGIMTACALGALVIRDMKPGLDHYLLGASVCFALVCYAGSVWAVGPMRTICRGAALFHGGTIAVVGGWSFPPLFRLCGPYMGWSGFWIDPDNLRGTFAVVAMASGVLGGWIALLSSQTTAPDTWIALPRSILSWLREIFFLVICIDLGRRLTAGAATWPYGHILATVVILISHQLFYLAVVFAISGRGRTRVYWTAFATSLFGYLWLETTLRWPHRQWLFPSVYLWTYYPSNESAGGVAYSFTALVCARYSGLVCFAASAIGRKSRMQPAASALEETQDTGRTSPA